MVGFQDVPRQRQEVERSEPLQYARTIPVTALGTTAATIVDAENFADFWIVHFWASNVTGSAATYTLYLVPDGGSAATSNTVVFQKSLAANSQEVVSVLINQRFDPSATLQGLCSTLNAINVGGWGYDIQGEYG